MKKKTLLSSVIAIILCLSLMTGASFALFTSEAKVNVAITSATVKVTATASDLKVYSMDKEMANNTFENGGTATMADNNLVLNLMTPGDKAEFNIAINNESNVAVKYQIMVIESGAEVDGVSLLDGLVLTVKDGANELAGVKSDNKIVTNWTELPVNATTSLVKTLTVSIELPATAGNEYQGLTANLAVNVTAVQGNATTTDPVEDNEKVKNLYTVEDVLNFAAAVNAGDTFKGKTVNLLAPIDLKDVAWTPIGNSTTAFQGTFDGHNNTISNLTVKMEGKSNVGFFGMTTNGEVKNVHINNADIAGRLNTAVVAGTPYTSKFNNIKLTGDIKVEGMSYVGAIGGKNCYASCDNLVVDANEGSYVKANSVENSTAYRTYVGGVFGFMGEGSHVVSNVTSNIDVIGSTCDVGGIVGIAHYGNKFVNITCTGDVTITNAADESEAKEIGGIAGVWMNSTAGDVTMANCKFTGKLSTNVNADLTNDNFDFVVGKYYPNSTDGNLIIVDTDKPFDAVASSKSEFNTALSNAKNAGKDAITITVPAGTVLSAIHYLSIPSGLTATIVGATIEGSVGLRNTEIYGSVIFNDCTFIATSTYAFHAGDASKDGSTIEFNNCKFYGWVSFVSFLDKATFNNCEIYGNGNYATIRAWCDTVFNNCIIDSTDSNFSDDYAEGVFSQGGASVSFNNCDLTKTTLVAADGPMYIDGKAVGAGVNYVEDENGSATVSADTSSTTYRGIFEGSTTITSLVIESGIKRVTQRSFQKMPNLTSISIPNTVTYLGEQAIAQTGLTEITIPASVTKTDKAAIGYNTNLETIVIEGNVEIGTYFARACTVLKSVYLKGDDVTFAEGGSMFFTNKENADASGITFYVVNQTIADRLYNAMSVSHSYGLKIVSLDGATEYYNTL